MEKKEVIYRKPPKRPKGGRSIKGEAKWDESKYEYKKALIYARVSSLTQASEGHGLESQEQRCRQYTLQKGYEVEQVFRDSFTGKGDFFKRPGMSALLTYLDARPHENYVVVFDDLKRFARDTQMHLQLRIEFKTRRARVECPNFTFDDTPEGEFVETIFAAQGALERQQNRRQVIQKMKARLEAGYWPFGPRKGFMHVKNPLHGKLAVPTEQSLEILKPALEMFATGVLSRKIDVCRYLVERRYWGEQKPERYIDKLANILIDPFYCGDVEYPAWEITRRQGQHQGIISRETFESIQKRLKKEGTGARVRIDTSPDFPLRGLVTCPGCGRKLTAAWSSGHSKKYGYYFCQTDDCPLKVGTIRREQIKDEFDLLLKKTRLKPEVEPIIEEAFADAWKEESIDMKERQQLAVEQARKVKEKMRRLTEEILSTKSDELKHVYEGQLEEAVKQLEDVEDITRAGEDLSVPYQTALSKATAMLRDPYSVWDSVDVHEKHRLFFFIFEERLAFSKTEGYQTANSPTAIRLFEEFAEENPLDVEVRRIELRSESVSGSASTTRSPDYL